MGIVLSFRSPQQTIDPAFARSDSNGFVDSALSSPDASDLVSRIRSLQDRVKFDLRMVVTSAGAALAYGRHVKDLISSPDGQSRLQEQIEMIETMLKDARSKLDRL
jgi:hypothetical protein